MRAFVLGQQVSLSDTLSRNYFSGAQIFITLSQLPPPALQAQPVAEMRRAGLLSWRKPPWKKAREQPSQWHVGGNAALAASLIPGFNVLGCHGARGEPGIETEAHRPVSAWKTQQGPPPS
ncbi:hypothetical protein CIB84_013093 [Bambusicola thoracicus]|uniref:Uncharacterized protein n=1 Tax=Bambusicola thoracicus TaxID=9083 RepID=A0A2P4SGC3_BAMTH|nr:hypothetical protein CIB84_013093 [Bambusicola thoracicus]